ncbi:MAG TPA: signal recognition particle-docking protein FtsY [Firmicutes bacterium]|nr:signal recognition particle-docking protein FtsY [Bacillota bacterium]
MGFFAKIKEALKKTKDAISYKFNKLFTGGVLNGEFYDELEAILLSADIGSETTESILDELKTVVDKKHITRTEDVRGELKTIMHDLLDFEIPEEEYPLVILMAGVNGVGKTTTVGKLAQLFRKKGKSVTIVAGDTFRAAAADQLTVWAERAGVRIVKQGEGADAAAVVYDALQSAKSKGTDVTIVDTAGRLHNKVNLMEELKKIDRVIDREFPGAMRLNYIVLDATTGQNALSQVDLFNEAIDIDGIVLTKLDGTAKGGVVLAIAGEEEVPVVYVGVGEGIDDLERFDIDDFVSAIVDGE